MDISTLNRIRILVTGLVTLLIFGLLFCENFQGGVITHHILQRKDLPGISNWWGLLLLPILTWFLLGRIRNRLKKQASLTIEPKNKNAKIFRLFLIGISFGIVLAISFTYDYQLFLSNVPYLLLVLSLLVPIYYAEFTLGFVFGMTYTFGAVIPTVFALILSIIGFLIFKFVRPLFKKAIRYLLKRHTP